MDTSDTRPALSRRQLLGLAVGTTAAAVGTTVLGGRAPAFAVAPNATGTGWAIGQLIPNLRARDTQGRIGHLRNRGRWQLLDVCATWCGPCNFSATSHRAFADMARAAGIPFAVLTVMVEGRIEGSAATLSDAGSWETRYALETELTLHGEGDPDSKVQSILGGLWAANGKPEGGPGYPTYALVDPTSRLRYYQLGAGMNRIQAELAAMTGVPLDRDWEF